MGFLTALALALSMKLIADNLPKLASKWRDGLAALGLGIIQMGQLVLMASKKKENS